MVSTMFRSGVRARPIRDDLRCELLRSRARLWCCELCRDQPAWAHFSGQRTDEECGELLARRGRYDLVTELAAALPARRSAIVIFMLLVVSVGVEESSHVSVTRPRGRAREGINWHLTWCK